MGLLIVKFIKFQIIIIDMFEKILMNIGLTKGEAKVYSALNKIGQSTIGPIIDESGISRSKIYDVLDR